MIARHCNAFSPTSSVTGYLAIPNCACAFPLSKGGLWHWKKIMEAAMRLQSLAATNQARLLLGPPSVVRLDAPQFEPTLRMNDWRRSVSELMPAADRAIATHGSKVAAMFLGDP